jgi:hypothetical protein
METLDELVEQIDNLLEDYIASGTRVVASRLGLDRRAGWDVWVSPARDTIGVQGKQALAAIRYYGGFEYVDEEHVANVANWTFYRADGCTRVQRALSFLDTAG